MHRRECIDPGHALAQIRATLPPLEKSLAQNRDALGGLGRRFAWPEHLPKFHLSDLALPKISGHLPSELVRQRPDIQASEALLHAASAQIGVATANFFPQITLTAYYGWVGTMLIIG